MYGMHASQLDAVRRCWLGRMRDVRGYGIEKCNLDSSAGYFDQGKF